MISALAITTVAAAAVFTAGAIAAEGALHPVRQEVAKVCPCFSHVHCESTSIKASDGVNLSAWYYNPDQPNGAAILLLHGIGSSRQDMVALGYLFLRKGYTVLEPDLRGHGLSAGFTTYGVLEENDVIAWLNWLSQNDRAARIYGFGASLGAAVILESLKRESRFRAVVAESSYVDFPSVARERIGRELPRGTRWIASPLVASGIEWTRWRYAIDLNSASPADGLRNTKVPVLLIHGRADNKTAPANSQQLAAIDPAAQLWLVPNSGHADAWKVAKEEFEDRVLAWFANH